MRQSIPLVTFLAALVLLACGSDNVRKDLGFAALRDDGLTFEQRQGKKLYEKYCMVCHGEEGRGDGFNSYNLDPRPRDFTDSERMRGYTIDRLAEVITKGGASVKRSTLMPAWGNTLRSYHILYIAEYVRTLWMRSEDDKTNEHTN